MRPRSAPRYILQAKEIAISNSNSEYAATDVTLKRYKNNNCAREATKIHIKIETIA